MRRYLLDTNSAGDFIEKRGSVPIHARAARRRGNRIGIGIPVLAELYYGIEFSSTREKKYAEVAASDGWIDDLAV